MIHLPAPKQGSTYVPFFPLAVGCQNECTFLRPDQNPYTAHLFPLSGLAWMPAVEHLSQLAPSEMYLLSPTLVPKCQACGFYGLIMWSIRSASGPALAERVPYKPTRCGFDEVIAPK